MQGCRIFAFVVSGSGTRLDPNSALQYAINPTANIPELSGDYPIERPHLSRMRKGAQAALHEYPLMHRGCKDGYLWSHTTP